MRYDMHLHTKYSSCSINSIPNIIKKVNKLKLDGIAITDHNSIRGALEMKKRKTSFDVIMGEEVMTDHGEILAYNISDHIKPGNVLEVLDNIKAQGALASLAHPFSAGIIRKRPTNVLELVKTKNLHAIETFNSRCAFDFENDKSLKFANQLNLGQTGGSDAHFISEIGRGLTLCTDDVLKEIKKKKTTTKGSNSNALGWRLLSLPVKFSKKLSK